MRQVSLGRCSLTAAQPKVFGNYLESPERVVARSALLWDKGNPVTTRLYDEQSSMPRSGDEGSPVINATRLSKGSRALDQWRGLALILVLISHGFFFTNRVNGVGRIGVNLFFFISGILVYRSLHRGEGQRKWQLSTSFWWRRWRRLYPALIAYAIVMVVPVALLQKMADLPLHSDLGNYLRTLPFAMTYLVNYHHDGAIALDHLWSVSCEMQFYLLAPVIFLLGAGNSRRRLIVYGGAALVLAGVGLIYPLSGSHYLAVKYHFEVAAWPMAFGLFCESTKAWFLRIPQSVAKGLMGFGIVIPAGIVIVMLFGFESKRLVIASGAMLLFPCLLSYLFGLTIPGASGRCLVWCGERTYSVYLWQQPLTLCGYLPPLLEPIGAAFAIVVGAFWFRVFEVPFLSGNRGSHLFGWMRPVHLQAYATSLRSRLDWSSHPRIGVVSADRDAVETE